MALSAIRVVGLLLLGVLVGCGTREDCGADTELSITAPADGAVIPAGGSVLVDYFYRRGDWAYNTLEIFANGTTVCGLGLSLSSTELSRSCSWNTAGQEPGEYKLEVIVSDTGGGIVFRQCRSKQTSSVTVTLQAAAPQITRQPSDVAVAEGVTATFEVNVRGSGPLTYRWQQSVDAGINFFDTARSDTRSFTTAPTTAADDGNRFRVVVGNSAGTATSDPATLAVVAADCPVPPGPLAYDTSAPPGGGSPVASYGTNLLVDGGFEGSVRVGFSPDGFGYWRADQAVTVGAAQQGIAPRAGGTRMLHFVGTGRADNLRGTASEQVQLVDVSALAADIDAGLVTADVSAWFSRVAGCAQTDDAMGIAAIAFAGPPTTYPQRVAAGIAAATEQGTSRDAADVSGVDAWLRHRTFVFRHNLAADKQGEVYAWRRGGGAMELPAGTRFIAMIVYADENVANDAAFPELHGHYADEAALVLSRR